MKSFSIRPATIIDLASIREVHLRAFPETEHQQVSALAADLLEDAAQSGAVALVAEVAGDVVGHIAFSPVWTADDPLWRGHVLAPLGVKPEFHKIGIGSGLVEAGLSVVSGKMTEVVFVYGDPGYYGKFGFILADAARFIPPYPLQYPFGWQARRMQENGVPDDRVRRLSCVVPLQNPALW